MRKLKSPVAFDPRSLARAGATVRGVNPATLAELLRPSTGVSEACFQAAVIELARALGYAVAHFRKVRVQRRDGSVYFETPVAADGQGFPDLELVRADPPRFVKAELKTAKGRVEPEQQVWMSRYEAVGIECYVWRPRDWDAIVKVLRIK